jgi:hypothetical protein
MQPLSRATVTSLFLMVTLILIMPVWANVLVDNLYCKPSSFKWWRNGKEQQDILEPYLFLQDGDQIKVVDNNLNGKKCFIALFWLENSPNNNDKIFLYYDSPTYRIESNNTSSYSLFKNISEITISGFKRRWLNHIWNIGGEGIKGEIKKPLPQLKIPLLEGNDVQLETGNKVLYLGWNGGKPPYHIQVSHKRKLFFDEKGIEEETITLKKQNWIVGRYQVMIRDSENNEVKQEFTVVNQIKVLSSTEATNIKQSRLPNKTTKPTFLATWLMKKNKKWRFEAYQLVVPIDEEYYPAFLVKQELKDLGQR